MAVLASVAFGPDRTFTVFGHRFGFQETWADAGDVTWIYAGPLGENYHVNLSAAVCGTIFVATLLLAMLSVALRRGVRFRRRPPA
jgi:hypothetical protein